MDQEDDLTIESIFASLKTKGLALTPHYHYRRKRDEDGMATIFDRGPLRLSVISERMFLIEDRGINWNFIETFRRIFGRDSAYHRHIDPYSYMYGEKCDRCGVELHALNRWQYGLCLPCEKVMKKEEDVL